MLPLVAVAGTCQASAIQCGTSISSVASERDRVSIARLGGSGHLVLWRDNRALDAGRVYLSFIDSLGRIAAGWPDDGVRLDQVGRRPNQLMISALGSRSAVAAWSAYVGPESGDDTYIATVRSSASGEITPAAIAIDSVTNRPGHQLPIGIVPLDEERGLLLIQDQTDRAQVLVKQVSVSGGGAREWPAEGVVLADEENVYPGGLAAVSACPDDSLGCLILAAGWTPIDLFHATITFHLFRLLPDGSRDPRWPRRGRVLTTDGDEFNMQNELVADGNGGAYVAWTTGNHSPSGRVRVMIQRVDRDGALHHGWGTDGIPAIPSDDALYQHYPRLTRDGRDRIVVLLESNDGRIRLKAIAGDGTSCPGWDPSGMVIGGIAGAPLVGSARLSGDDTTGIVAAWAEVRGASGAPPELIASVVDSDGELLTGWPAGGKALCPSPQSELLEALDCSANGSLAIAWRRGPDEVRFGRFGIRDGALAIGAEARHASYTIDGPMLKSRWMGSVPDGVCLYGLRRVDAGPWAVVDSAQRTGPGEFELTDPWPPTQSSIEYRLGASIEGDVQAFSDTLRIDTPAGAGGPRLTMKSVQSGRSLWLFLTVTAPEGESVSLESYDVSGRSLADLDLGHLSPGTHLVELGLPRARQGMVFVRASSPSGSWVTRVALLR